MEGETSIFQQTQIECKTVSSDDDVTSMEGTERNFLEEFRRFKESLITVKYGENSLERATDEGG